MDELTSVFIQEGREQLQAMETGLLDLEQQPDNHDNINGIFRAAHTIKGASGVIECHYIEAFMHKVENVLDRLRNGEIGVSDELTGLLLRSCDHLGRLMDVLESGAAAPEADVQQAGDALLVELAVYTNSGQKPATGGGLVEMDADVEASGGGVVNTDSWHISVRFGPHMLRGGMDPLSFIRFLSSLGEIVALETIPDAMPTAADMDPESCYLGFEIRLQTRSSKADIERVFDFCRDDCDLRILPPNSKLSEYLKLIHDLPEDEMRLGEILVRCGALTAAELEAGLDSQHDALKADQDAESEAPQIGEILVEQKVVHKAVVEAAASKQASVSEKKAVEARLIRVQADKLDQLIDLVGELVIAGASANLLAQRSGQSELVESTSILSRLVEDIRDSALQLRMVQIGETFNRFNRVVRDVAKELGKEIDLVITGAETELDKSVVEKIGDPLMHLVRNSMDHGIESPEVREAAGKVRHGTVGLNAYHDSGSIVIEVVDDGAGLPRDKIFAKAVEKGLVQPTQTLTDQEIINLIWEPGFSTAEKVTNLSGRGVGMDVVRRNIQSLRGSCEVSSIEGAGTTFTIRLPLTLAIIDGFLVGVGRAAYVIPLDMVIECIELKDNTAERDFLNLRGEVLPFVRLREMFEIEGERPVRENIVVVQYAGQKAGIVVDQLMGEFQTVIKPLSSIFRHLRGIGGSTILGSGEVALILDVQSLVQRNARSEEREMSASAALPRSTQIQ
ncbi:chemotaxis protein CheA [Dechloromonas sp.]|uniref:chemotaxis protein CheA n=1 Tax=Dechloromonas sp. TaxID=1917218 RepID=UPI00121E8060|nr:chemotaxis protein CheA [Dechloromonas sp.]MBU3697336.1 chemotaxis protein CheA [Dechloromonas sp.]TEX49616.1 MAG: chemotaxis protein CheA [Rhodocyclaceae bacterium]